MIELRCVSPGHWESPDGRVLISLDPTFETECDEPHPVKFSRAERDEFASMTSEQRARLQRRDGDRYWALVEGKKGCYCHGGEVHYYSQWTARIDGTWTENVYDTFAEARQDVEAQVGQMRLVRGAAPSAKVAA